MITYKERQRRHAVLLHRAESVLAELEKNKDYRKLSTLELYRAKSIILELKERGRASTYNDNIADFFARCGFYIGGNITNKALYKIKFSIDE